MATAGIGRDTQTIKPLEGTTYDATNTLSHMGRTYSIPATRSNTPTGTIAALGDGSEDSPEWCGVSGSTRRSTPQRVTAYSHAPRWLLILGVAIVLGLTLDATADKAQAYQWHRDTATWYGPGFYGNTTACGQRYTQRIRGVAVPGSGPRHMRCGAKLTICRRGGCVRVRVIDTGGFRNHQFDLSARTAMDLCKCWRPYTMTVRWKRGWVR